MNAALILDFDGVCTLSSSEQINDRFDAMGPLTQVIRPEAVAAFTAARSAGMTTVILSNELDRRWLDNLDLTAVTDHIVVGADNGIFKPDRRAFQRCLLLTGSPAEQTILVDDNPDNVTVAQSLGLTAILFDTKSVGSVADSWAAVHNAVNTTRS